MSLRSTLLSLALATPALAQSSPFAGGKDVVLPSSTDVSDKGRMVVGDVTGDLLPDAILLDDGYPQVLYGIGITTAAVPSGEPANDLALVRGDVGQAAALALVGSEGLVVLSDYDAGEFSSAVHSQMAWLGALRVVPADLDGDGGHDLVALGAGATTLLFARDARDAQPTFSQISLPEAAFDLVALDWMGSAAQEIAVLTSSGLRVIDSAGQPKAFVSATVDGGRVVALRQAGFAFERCAFLVVTGTLRRIRVADRTLTEAPLSLGGVDVYSLDAADVDLDGDEDLLVAAREEPDLIVLQNQSDGAAPGGTPTFSLGALWQLGVGQLPREQDAQPRLADLDRDGDVDLVAFHAGLDRLLVRENGTLDADAQHVVLDGGLVVLDEVGETITVFLDVTVPGDLPSVELTVWTQPDLETDSDPQALVHATFEVDELRKALLVAELGPVGTALERVHNLDVRAVLESGGSLVAAGPSALFALGLVQEVDEALLEAYPNPPMPPMELEAMAVPVASGSPSPPMSQGREITPIVICIPDVPDFCIPPDPVPPPGGGN